MDQVYIILGLYTKEVTAILLGLADTYLTTG